MIPLSPFNSCALSFEKLWGVFQPLVERRGQHEQNYLLPTHHAVSAVVDDDDEEHPSAADSPLEQGTLVVTMTLVPTLPCAAAAAVAGECGVVL